MKRTGIFGGTFNPIHCGHLINIEIVREFLKLDRIFFIPARDPVHKKITDDITPQERLEMVKLAIMGNSYFMESSLEIDRDDASYTLFTLRDFSVIYPDDKFFLIIGADSFNELDTWMSFTEILQDISIAVMKRPGDPGLRTDLAGIAADLHVVDNPEIGISSTMIREMVRAGKSIRYLVPDSVYQYILSRGLYKN